MGILGWLVNADTSEITITALPVHPLNSLPRVFPAVPFSRIFDADQRAARDNRSLWSLPH
ncbi:hypothetical protein B5K05_23060 [Rhizobium phaseoli]|uniref:Uncharacterized protein n=1 Tax=Rhizobium etli (strain CIAT 652) TaxID=491916 RepID=B3Q3P1_RHIE6|nr:hypothetical protein RHECIAT_PC0000721 [Rhizobium etli CIAT 652]KKZ84004.1 hypothetical protein RPHASCH2410_PD03650 [Rhizobium phaseoli Ch24-10]PDS73974.1 hypothetical protein CO651_03765 [Rhizobium phaseoli]RDJ04945.1 hypothetical protein B5K04_23000 [Rhizobium phaseoli]RDJ07187.1 hypothetical protein B5K05_23060 [Rhizobium phaseoli]